MARGDVDLEQHYRKLERTYCSARINEVYEHRLTVSREAAELELELGPSLHHAAGAVHGSVYFKALDDAAFFAANSVVTDVFLLTSSFTVYLLRPVSRGVVRARGKLVSRSPRLLVAESVLTDESDNLLARGSGTFMPSSIRLTPDVGYE